MDGVGLLSKPGCWLCDPDMGEYKNPEISEAVAGGVESGASPALESVIHQPSTIEVALGFVLGGLLGRHSRSMPRELNFKDPGRQEGPFVLSLNRHSLYVCVLSPDPPPKEVHGLIGLTPDELGPSQSLDDDLAFIFARLKGEVEPEEGELFLANPAVKNNHINRNLFLLDYHKVLWRKSGEEGTAFGGPLVSPQGGSPQAVP